MTNKELKSAAEAVLFAYAEPLELQKLADALETDTASAEKALNTLRDEYESRKSGLSVLLLDGKYQLATKPEYAPYIKNLMEQRRKAPLSQAAFEVLAVIAYNQPVTKAFVEQVRGVDCSGVIGSLLRRELIEEAGRLDLPGRPLLYCTTTNFLRTFCISSLDELPELPDKASDKDEGEDVKTILSTMNTDETDFRRSPE